MAGLRFDDIEYLSTTPGNLRLIQIVLSWAIGLVTHLFRDNIHIISILYTDEIKINAALGFWFSSLLLLLHLFHVIEAINIIPWLLIELICDSILAVSLLIMVVGSLIQTSGFTLPHVLIWAFGFIEGIAYLHSALLKFRAIRDGQSAQSS